MGVDCKVRFPAEVDYEDVALAVGALLGLTPSHETIGGNTASPFEAARAHPGVTFESFDFTHGMIRFDFSESPIDKTTHSAFWHFAGSYGSGDGYHLLSLRSTAVWIAVAKRLVELFGGTADFDDCDDIDADIVAPLAGIMAAFDGEDYSERQRRLYELTSITKAEIAEARGSAAYK